jgi:hypothetical protein
VLVNGAGSMPAFLIKSMGTILSLLRKIEVIDTDKVCVDTMEESKEVLADYNAEQINTGLRSDGVEMPPYSNISVDFYGKPEGPIRLRETGAWQAGLYVKIEGSKVIFESSDEKDEMLTKRYTDKIHGLSEKYKAEAMREKVIPVFKSKIQLSTGLKFK